MTSLPDRGKVSVQQEPGQEPERSGEWAAPTGENLENCRVSKRLCRERQLLRSADFGPREAEGLARWRSLQGLQVAAAIQAKRAG